MCNDFLILVRFFFKLSYIQNVVEFYIFNFHVLFKHVTCEQSLILVTFPFLQKLLTEKIKRKTYAMKNAKH